MEGRELYWLSRQKQSESIITNAVLEKKLKISITLRSTTTIAKLAAKGYQGQIVFTSTMLSPALNDWSSARFTSLNRHLTRTA